jgi:two-component system response regulator GlrR
MGEAEKPVLPEPRPHRGARRRADALVGRSRAVQRAQEQIQIGARGRFPVWIQAEPGLHPETIARGIHEHSERAMGAFLALDAEVVPPALGSSELFGRVEAAPLWLPAAEGALRRAHRGTVLVENLEALPKQIQETLATALERGEARPIGDETAYPLECRWIASSTHPLHALHGNGRIVPELAERLSLLEIVLPPLHERLEDIEPIAVHELGIRAAEIEYLTGQVCPVRGFSHAALDRLRSHPWPGGERELRAQIRAALDLARGAELGPGDLLLGGESSSPVPSFREAKRAFEKEYVTRVLRLCHGNITRGARMAQKDRKDFHDLVLRSGIDRKQFRI